MVKPGKLELRSYPLPEELDPKAVLLEVLQTNVCGSDIHIFEGRHPLLKCGGLGHEMVGRVLRLGSARNQDSAGQAIAVGDRIVPMYTSVCHACENCNRGITSHCDHAFRYFGKSDTAPFFHGATFSSHYYVHADQPFFRVPESVSTAAAASANCALSQVLHGIDKANVGLDQTVVIQGAGGLGQAATAVAKERGARVLVMDMVPSRLALAKDFGADAVLDIRQYSTLESRIAAVQKFARAQGADVAIEVTGVPAAFSEGVSYLRPEGVYVVMGTISPGIKADFDPGAFVRKSARLMGVNRYPPRYLHAAMRFLEAHEEKYPFERLLDQSYALANAQEAIEASARREVQRATIIPEHAERSIS